MEMKTLTIIFGLIAFTQVATIAGLACTSVFPGPVGSVWQCNANTTGPCFTSTLLCAGYLDADGHNCG